MATPEDFRVQHEAALARVPELSGRIVRAQRWNQLFVDRQQEEAGFIDLVTSDRFYYKDNDPLVTYSVESHPDGEVHRIVKNEGYATTYQRLRNGDVVLTFHSPNKPPRVNMITPSIGNIAHPFTPTDIVIPSHETVMEIYSDEDRRHTVAAAIGTDIEVLAATLRGKPATQAWEDTMLYNGCVPQRVGFNLYPDFTLDALAKLKEVYPHLLPKTAFSRFMDLEIGWTMEIPASLLTPTTIDDMTFSHTFGPIEVYPLRTKIGDRVFTAIWIADGCHRYFDKIRDARSQSSRSGTPFNHGQVMLDVKKVIPDRDNDIRYMFNTTDWFE